MFTQLSLGARGIATKGMQHGLIAWRNEDKDAPQLIVIVRQTGKVNLFCIVLTHVVS